VQKAWASSTGFLRAIAMTQVPMDTFVVRAASAPSSVIVSSHGMSEMVRSVTQIEAIPPSSAASTAGHRDRGGTAGGRTRPSSGVEAAMGAPPSGVRPAARLAAARPP
jgi:hypothetical protein